MPVCEWANYGNSGTFNKFPCSLKFGADKGLLKFYKDNPGTIIGCSGSSGGTSCPLLKISNLKTPKYKGTYSLRALVYGDQG